MKKEQNLKNSTEQALTIPVVSGSFLLRLLLSPLLFLWGIFMLAAGAMFPLPLIVMFSICGMISVPFVWLLRKSGSKIDYPEPFICNFNDIVEEKNIFRNHFFGATIYIWGAFAVAYHYIKTGEIFTGESITANSFIAPKSTAHLNPQYHEKNRKTHQNTRKCD